MNEHAHDHKPRLKRIHHSLIFWFFSILMLAAIIYYAMTVDFAFAPHRPLTHPAQNSRTP